MRRLTAVMLVLAACLGLAGAAGAWIIAAPRPAFGEADAAALEVGGDSARGALVFLAADCGSCHVSPGQADRSRLGGGLSLAAPFGIFNVPNISPDPADGIGRWRTVDLANTLLSGVSPRGEHYYPALPYTSFSHMRVDDVRDLMAYLRSLPPVAGRTAPHDLPLVFKLRRLVGLWKLLFFRPGEITPDPAHDGSWNRGRYLVEALGHCAECHSSRNLAGGLKTSTRFAGGPDNEGTGYVPNITPGRIGHWSPADLATLLATGITPERRRVGSTMADVVRNTSQLPESDRQAIAAYVTSLPARPTPDQTGER